MKFIYEINDKYLKIKYLKIKEDRLK